MIRTSSILQSQDDIKRLNRQYFEMTLTELRNTQGSDQVHILRDRVQSSHITAERFGEIQRAILSYL